MKIKFLETCKVKAENGETFSEGKTYEVNEASANHWVRRGKAEVVGGVVAALTPVKEPVADKAKGKK